MGAASDPNGATRKGLGIVSTDGFTVIGTQTAGPLTGFGMEVKNSTGGHLNGLKLKSGAATQDGPTAYLTDCGNVTLRNVTLRGRRNGQFLRAIRRTGLRVTGA